MARGGDDYVMFRDIEPVLPVADPPTAPEASQKT
jgi:hypothetical protein